MSVLALVAAGLLLLLGALQLLMSRRQRRRTGLPGGQVVYRDVEEQRGATLRLQPANSALTPLIVHAGDVCIQGTVVAVLRDV